MTTHNRIMGIQLRLNQLQNDKSLTPYTQEYLKAMTKILSHIHIYELANNPKYAKGTILK